MPKYYTQAQAAAALGISQPAVSKAIKNGKLGTKHADGTYTVTQQDIETYKATRTYGRPSLARPEEG